MKTSLLCPEHPKSNPSPSTGPELERSQPGPGPSPRTRPRHPARPEEFQSQPRISPAAATWDTGHPPTTSPLRSARPDPAQPQPRPEAHTTNRTSKLTADSFSSAILAPPTAARPEVAGFPDDQANGNGRTGEEGRGLNRERSRSPSGRVSLGGWGSSRMSELVERFRAVHLALKEPVRECAASRRFCPCQPLSPHALVWTFLEKPPDSAGYSHSWPCSALTPPSVISSLLLGVPAPKPRPYGWEPHFRLT